jgi:F-type H+-transporting ATPase subunit b
MSLSANLQAIAGSLVQVEFDIDEDGFVTAANPILPPIKEIFIGGAASLIVFVALWKLAGPAIAKAMRNRTARIQGELDGATGAKAAAETQAAEIRAALGDIEGERQRIFAEADAQAEAILTDGRSRLDQEIADLHVRADADIAAAATRSGDELRTEIGRHSSAVIDRVVAQSLGDTEQQELIESFIQRVGATGAGSAPHAGGAS